MTVRTRFGSALAPIFALTCLLAVGAPAGAQNAELASRVDAIADRSPLDRAHWGIFIQDAATGEVIYERNADRLFIPASNLKLVVATTALGLMPADHRLRTSLYTTGPLRNGVVEGDLVLYGRGDPGISGRYRDDRMLAVWEDLADSLAARGVREVRGGLVADESWFDSIHVHGDWESYDLLWWYAAPVSALGFNDNSIDFRISPGAIGQPARIEWQPVTSFVVLSNRTRTVAAGAERTLDFERGTGDTIIAYGTLPADERPWTEYFAVRDPARYAGTVFREVLESRGIRFGTSQVRVVRAQDRSVARANPVELVGYESAPLSELIFPILNSSQNWFAEQLLKALGRDYGAGGTWEAGLDVERRFLTERVGLDEAEFRLRDASGLSAGNLITPRALARVLMYGRDLDVLREALPVSAAQRGSLRSRFTDMPGRVRAKTGGIRNVDALSGFVTSERGRELVFVVIVNGSAFPGSTVRAAIDDVVRAAAATN